MTTHQWTTKDIEEQKGRTVIVTGAASGIGLETARVLAAKNATVIMAVRNLDKGKAALDQIIADHTKADLHIMALDLANLKSVRQFAKNFKITHARLDLLINNAGVMIPPYSKTADGFELQLGTNHLGHFALTGQLFNLLNQTPGSRVVTVSSAAHKFANINFSDLNWVHRTYKPWQAYGDSKVANLMFTKALAKKLKAQGSSVVAAAAHPGWAATNLQRHTGVISFLNHFFSQDAAAGALPTLYAATAPDVQGGEYFGPDGFQEMKGLPHKVDSSALSKDEEKADLLWNISKTLTGVSFFKTIEQAAA